MGAGTAPSKLYEPEWLRDHPREQPLGEWAIGRWAREPERFSGPIGAIPFPDGQVTLSPMTFVTEAEVHACLAEMSVGSPTSYDPSIATWTPPACIDRPLRLADVVWVVTLIDHHDGSHHLVYEGKDNTQARIYRYAAIGKGAGANWRPVVEAHLGDPNWKSWTDPRRYDEIQEGIARART